jgi:hypothetical protein
LRDLQMLPVQASHAEPTRGISALISNRVRLLFVTRRTSGYYPPVKREPSRVVLYLGRVVEGLLAHIWPIVVSVANVGLGLAYFFRWGSVVQHIPSSWTMPYDYAYTYLAASQLAHGHIGAIYSSHISFVEFPGIVVAMAPLGALSGVFHTTLFQVVGGQAYVIQHYSIHYSAIPFLTPGWFIIGGKEYVADPQWAIATGFYALLLGCTALFAFDALAKRLRVSQPRRAILTVVEAVLLWNVTVLWGHPEDAVAIALAVYSLVLALDHRFKGAGWLFGAAVAFQPLVLLMLPVLLAMAGRKSALGFAIRSILPAATLVAFPLIANFSTTFHALIEQPNYPNRDHATPWTALSPQLGGKGLTFAVAGGPGRVVAILLAVLVGIWVFRRWRERPELLVFACVLALSFRDYTESVMDAYYPWAALAVGVVLAARCTRWRFAVAIALAIAATIVAQWSLAWLPWWIIQMGALTALLIVSARPATPLAARQHLVNPAVRRTAMASRGESRTGSARSSATSRVRTTTVAQKRSTSQKPKKRPVPPAGIKRSRHR